MPHPACSRALSQQQLELFSAMLWMAVGGRQAATSYLRSAMQHLLKHSSSQQLE